ncbi:uncharacterized protein EV154DRAFT_510013 [Mucor mucedo]|uniref:uncharacterized protein n=1 Tax=Mucor mucedo TaxID=29922 RepID=UPI00221E9D61|nr:uncharacterized protein EV154DRAFT_510013 [Mucor mucedo]KAI7890927.1 hypothetical protein EV154DRAFT_510013 [Mucor mucedo]
MDLYKYLDLIEWSDQKLDNVENSSDNFWITWIPSISQQERLPSSRNTSNLNVSPSVIFFTVLICVLVGVIIAVSMLKNRKTAFFTKPYACSYQRIINFFCSRRVGETFATQMYGLVTNLVSFMLLMLFIAYFVYSIVNSPVSTTEEVLEATDIPFPDVRFCYTGWKYDSYNDTTGNFPQLTCESSDDVDNCEDVYKLPRSIMSPHSLFSDTLCYMYSPSKDKLNYIYEGVHLQFFHVGNVMSDNEQSTRIQIYEPAKNPNRQVFNISPLPNEWSVEYLDDWMDMQTNNSFVYGTSGQKIAFNGVPGVSIHFKMTYTQKIDPDSLWNLVGVFPKYIQMSELSIINSEILGSPNASFDLFHYINIYPVDNKKILITEKRDITIISTLGVLGGIVSMLIAARVFLFGAKPTEPWGVFQRLSLRSNREQNKSENLRKYFLIPGVDNIPFVTPVHQRFSDIYAKNKDRHVTTLGNSSSVSAEMDSLINNRSDAGMRMRNNTSVTEINHDVVNALKNMQERLDQLEGRNQILELVLKAYYIDDRIFREIHETTKKETSSVSDLEMSPLSEVIKIEEK